MTQDKIHYFGESSLRALWAKIKLADSSLDSSINKVLGNVEDSSALATVYGAKKYAKEYADGLIADLDSEKTHAAGADGLALSITEVDGKITEINGSIAANTYDAYGAAAGAKSDVIGVDTDPSTANTIYGAKKYAKEYADSVVDSFVDGLDSSLGHTAGADGIGVFVEIENGKLKSVDASIAPNIYDAHGAAATAKSEVIGANTDASTADTIYGAKKHADAKAAEVLGTNADSSVNNTVYGAKAYADAKKQEAIDTLVGKDTDPSTANTVYGAKAYTDSKVAGLAQALVWKGSVATFGDLPTDASIGDVYNVIAAYGTYPAGTNYAYSPNVVDASLGHWDPLGGAIDTSAWLTKENLIEITADEVNAICI